MWFRTRSTKNFLISTVMLLFAATGCSGISRSIDCVQECLKDGEPSQRSDDTLQPGDPKPSAPDISPAEPLT